MKTTFEFALCTVIGGTLAALLDAYRFLSRDLPLPPCYRTKAYYLVRGMIILLAGTLPWASAHRTSDWHLPWG